MLNLSFMSNKSDMDDIEIISPIIQFLIVSILNYTGYLYLAIHFFRFGTTVQFFIFGSLSLTLLATRIYQIRERGNREEIMEFYTLIFSKIVNLWKVILVFLVIIYPIITFIPFLSDLVTGAERISFIFLIYTFFFTLMVETLMNSVTRQQEEIVSQEDHEEDP